MIFKKFELEFYRSFVTKQSLKLAIPKNDQIGSGITYLVGENNSGKTTIIEGIFMNSDQKIRSSEKQNAGGPSFELYNNKNLLVRKLSLIRSNSYTLIENPKIPDSDSFEIIPSRRHWQSSAGGRSNVSNILNSTAKEQPRSPTSNTQISLALKDIEANENKYRDFISYVKSVIPNFSSFSVGFEDSEFIEYETTNGVRHKSDFLGDGIISLLRILTHLFIGNTRPLIIDEPELSLHPKAQDRLLKLIAEESQKRQILISTHSPYFLNWEYIANGAVVNRVTKNNDSQSRIYSLKRYSKYEKLINGANWQQPFLMDTVAKEIFFNDNILFVEGQEDVGLLRQENVLSDNINIFGYGVRGISSFELALSLAYDLGINKAAVLMDNGTEELKVKATLDKKFSKYKVVVWNRNDIRDKKVYTSKVKTGYFTAKGKIKPKADLDDFHDKVDALNKHFKPSN